MKFIGLLILCCCQILTCALATDIGTNQIVSLERAQSDRNYGAVVNHHRCIKSYLARLANEKTELDKLLLFLIRTGFSIDDLPKLYFAVHAPISHPSDDLLHRRGFSDDEIQVIRDREEIDGRMQRREIVQIVTGVDNEGLLDKIMEFVPNSTNGVLTNSDFVLLVDVVDGERLLTDVDWMTPAFHQAALEYQGPTRTMFPNPEHHVKPTIEPRFLPALPAKK